MAQQGGANLARQALVRLVGLHGQQPAAWRSLLSDGGCAATTAAGGASAWRRAAAGRAGAQAWRAFGHRGASTTSAGGGAAAQAAAGAAAAAAGGATASAAAAAPRSLPRRLRALLRDYKQLSKARLSALVVLTASAGFVAGSEGAIDWPRLAWSSLGTFGAAACANALNQAYEAANDARMNRTRGRPLPAGRMGRAHALAFAAAAGAAGLWLLYEKANPLTAALGAANIVLYAGVYTPLKQLTWANTWVGAVVGAIPPLMGWAAAAGELEPASAVLAAALFFWQMPHFLSLAWLCREDYARGGFKMLSMFDATGRRTAAAALRHCAYLLPVGFAAVALGVAGPWFAAEATLLGAGMGAGAVAFYRAPSQASARKLFRGSLLYLPLLLAALAVHRRPNAHDIPDWAEASRRLRQQWDGAWDGLREAAAPLGAAAKALAPALAAPEVRLKTIEERLGWVEELRWKLRGQISQIGEIKCPSRAYAEDGSGGGDPARQEQEGRAQEEEQEQEQAAGGCKESSSSGGSGSSSSGSGSGGGSSSTQ